MPNKDNTNLSLYFMEDNPVEAILIKNSKSSAVLMNGSFKKMFSLQDFTSIEEVITFIFKSPEERELILKRITSLDNSFADKPVKLIIGQRKYYFYVYYHSSYELIIIHARDMTDFDKLSSQLDDYAQGLVQNIFDLEISQRKLVQSKNRLHRQLKASTKLGLTVYQSFKTSRNIFRSFTEIAAQTLEVDRCSIWLIEENKEKLICSDLYISSREEHLSDINLENKYLDSVYSVLQSDRIIGSDLIDKKDEYKDYIEQYINPNKISSILISSIVLKGKFAGIVTFEQAGNKRIWEDDENAFAVIFADHVSRILSDVEKSVLESQLIQSQKMETIGTLVSGLAHDFNNILVGIVGTLSIIKYSYKDSSDEEINNYFEIMENASDRATDLVKQLLAVAGKHELTLAPVDLNLTIKRISKICRNTFDRSVEIIINYNNNDPMVNGDPIQLEQVLLNLLINAYHAMTVMRSDEEEQGGELTISIKKFRGDESFIQKQKDAKAIDYWVITVEDTGIGMDKNTMSKIFEPFYTTKKSTNVKGSGLGLTMVYNIVHEHEGFIDVESEVNRGTVVSVYLPAYDHIIARQDLTKGKEIIKGSGTILVIDDESLIRLTTRKILETCGYKVILASDGTEGISLYMQNINNIDLVILDMAMPKKSGRDTYYEIKKINPAVKVLLATGYKNDDRSIEILQSGVQGFILKPFTIYDLSMTVDKIINGRSDD